MSDKENITDVFDKIKLKNKEEILSIFTEMLEHIENHYEAYGKWTNEEIVKTWMKTHEHRLSLIL